MEESGYIYILYNPAMVGIVKIGKTKRSPEDRATELSSGTNVPLSFEVVYRLEVKNVDIAEKAIHKKLENYRINKGREFFRISIEQAIKELNEHLSDYKNYSGSSMNPFVIDGMVFLTIHDLLEYFNSSHEKFKIGIKHLESGNIRDWLDRNHDYDNLLKLDACLEIKDDLMLVLFKLYFEITNKQSFIVFGENINYRIIYEIFHESKKSYDLKKIDSLGSVKLRKIFSLFKKNVTKSDLILDKYLEICVTSYLNIGKSFLEWVIFPEKYYLKFGGNNFFAQPDLIDERYINSIDSNIVKKILTKKEIEKVEDEKILTYQLLSRIKSSDLNTYLSAYNSIFRDDEQSYYPSTKYFFLEKGVRYAISDKLYNRIPELDLSLYEEISDVLIIKEDFDDWKAKYNIPKLILNSIYEDDIELFVFSSRLLELACRDYYFYTRFDGSQKYFYKYINSITVLNTNNGPSFKLHDFNNTLNKDIIERKSLAELKEKVRDSYIKRFPNSDYEPSFDNAIRELLGLNSFEQSIREFFEKYFKTNNSKIKSMLLEIVNYNKYAKTIFDHINPIKEIYEDYLRNLNLDYLNSPHQANKRYYNENYKQSDVFGMLSNFIKEKHSTEPIFQVNFFKFHLEYFFIDNNFIPCLTEVTKQYVLPPSFKIYNYNSEIHYLSDFIKLLKHGLVKKSLKNNKLLSLNKVYKGIEIIDENKSSMFNSQYAKEIFNEKFVQEIVIPNDLKIILGNYIELGTSKETPLVINYKTLIYYDNTIMVKLNFVYKKNIPPLINAFYFPNNIEKQLCNISLVDYLSFNSMLEDIGIILFATYEDLEMDYCKKEKRNWQSQFDRIGGAIFSGYLFNHDNITYTREGIVSMPINSKLVKSMSNIGKYHIMKGYSNNEEVRIYTNDYIDFVDEWILLKDNKNNNLLNHDIVNLYKNKVGIGEFKKIRDYLSDIFDYPTFQFLIANQLKYRFLLKFKKVNEKIIEFYNATNDKQFIILLKYLSNSPLISKRINKNKAFTKKDKDLINKLYGLLYTNPFYKLPIIGNNTRILRIKSMIKKYGDLFPM